MSSEMLKNFTLQAKLIQVQQKITITTQTDSTQVSFLLFVYTGQHQVLPQYKVFETFGRAVFSFLTYQIS